MDFLAQSAFGEIAVLLVTATAVGIAGTLLRQPLIVSFIAAGLIAGPSALNLVRSEQHINLLSELGITVLLFLVGIKLDVKLIRSLGKVALLTGLGQVAFTSFFGFLVGMAFGFDFTTSLYIAVALTFSSTIIIVKLLSDKREIDSLHGQIALGFLIVQDLVVVLAMIVLATIGISGAGEQAHGSVLIVALAGVGLVGLVALFIRYVATPLTERLAHAPELLVIFAISLAALFAATCEVVGLGKEIGGLLGGVSLASSPYRENIAARLAPLRDFLLLFFFIALGSTLDLSLLGSNISAALVFSIFVLIGNPLIVVAIMGVMGYRKRTSFLAGLTVAQISEFSLIFVTMGVSLGHITSDALGLVTLVGLVTIAASTYMITYSHHLYARFEPMLSPFERMGTPREPADLGNGSGPRAYDVVIFGLGRFGTAIGQRLQAKGVVTLGIDFNPAAVREWSALGLNAKYGDASDPEFLSTLPLGGVNWVVSTITVRATGLGHHVGRHALIKSLREVGFSGSIAVTSHGREDDDGSLTADADLVLEPFLDAADRAVELLSADVRSR